MPTLNIQVGDKISQTIKPGITGGQVISAVVHTVNSANGKNIYTCTVPSGTIVADEDYTVLSQTVGQSTGPNHWVVGSATNENSAGGGE